MQTIQGIKNRIKSTREEPEREKTEEEERQGGRRRVRLLNAGRPWKSGGDDGEKVVGVFFFFLVCLVWLVSFFSRLFTFTAVGLGQLLSFRLNLGGNVGSHQSTKIGQSGGVSTGLSGLWDPWGHPWGASLGRSRLSIACSPWTIRGSSLLPRFSAPRLRRDGEDLRI
jgi:hypothetical protein